MVGLLGMLAAGGAMGARDASNASVRAQNELEIGNAREALREEFLNRRFDKELDVAKESSKAKAQQEDIKYQRDLDAKKEQYAHELKKTGLLNQGRLDAEDRRNEGANARLNKRLAADNAKVSSKDKEVSDDLYVTLKDGRKYLPQTDEEKRARTIVLASQGKTSFEEALMRNKTAGFVGNAARDPLNTFSNEGLTGKAREMIDQIYGNKGNATGYELSFDPKSKKLVPMGQ